MTLDIRPEDLRIVQELLSRHVPELEVWAFGSRVQEKARPYSDLDLALLTKSPLPLERHAQLAEALSESDLGIKVDLVDWSRTTEAFRQIIRESHVVIQGGVSDGFHT